jgi:hypothetical protein
MKASEDPLLFNSSVEISYKNCIDFIINHAKFEKYLIAHDPMYDAMKYNNEYAIEKLIAKFGFNVLFLEELNKRSLKNFLDSRVRENWTDESLVPEITIDYSFMQPEKRLSDNDLTRTSIESLHYIVTNSEVKNLIAHPVLSYYIDERFRRYNNLYLLNFMLFLVLFCLPILLHYYTDIPKLPFISMMYLIIREFFQFIILYKRKSEEQIDGSCKSQNVFLATLNEHFISKTNVMETLLIIASILLGLAPSKNVRNYKQKLIAVVLLGSFELGILITETFPMQTRQLLMFRTIIKNSIGIIFMIVGFNVAFAFAFHLNVKGSDSDKAFDNFSEVFLSLVKVMVMFSGELDVSNIWNDNAFFGVFFFLFLICVMILLNFFNAMVISDVQVNCTFI